MGLPFHVAYNINISLLLILFAVLLSLEDITQIWLLSLREVLLQLKLSLHYFMRECLRASNPLRAHRDSPCLPLAALKYIITHLLFESFMTQKSAWLSQLWWTLVPRMPFVKTFSFSWVEEDSHRISFHSFKPSCILSREYLLFCILQCRMFISLMALTSLSLPTEALVTMLSLLVLFFSLN